MLAKEVDTTLTDGSVWTSTGEHVWSADDKCSCGVKRELINGEYKYSLDAELTN